MAPGRKRGGAKGAKANNRLNLGDLVLAKVKGHPAWPAKISKPEDWERIPDPRKYFVQFYGTEEIAFVAPADIQPFTRESKNKLVNRCSKGKTVKYFSQAVKEICDIFEGMECKNTGSSKDDNDGQTSQPDASSNEMLDMTTDGPSGEASPNNEYVNYGPGLERCSVIKREMEYEDGNRIISPNVDHRSDLDVSNKKLVEQHCDDDIISPKKDGISTSGSGHNRDSKSGVEVETNGKYTKKTERDYKKKHDNIDGSNKIHRPVGVSSASQTSHKDKESIITEKVKDGIRRSSSNGSKNEVTVGISNKKIKNFKEKTNAGVAADSVKEKNGNNGVSHPAKRSKVSDDAPKRPLTHVKDDVYNKRRNQVKDSTLKGKNSTPSKVQIDGPGHVSGESGDEDVFPPTKRRRKVIEDRLPESITPKKGENNDSIKSGHQLSLKRRAVRIVDDDEDEPKTPVHVRPHILMSEDRAEAIQNSPSVRNSIVNTKEFVSNSQQDTTELDEGKSCNTPVKPESVKKSSEEVRKAFVSPIKSPLDAHNKLVEPHKVNKSLGKVSSNVPQKKVQTGPSKASSGIHDTGHRSQNSSVNERSRHSMSGEKHKSTIKSVSRIDTSVIVRKPSDNSSLSSERSEVFRLDRTTLLAESKSAESKKSMRDLIAVAQAKRKQAQSQNHVHDILNFPHMTTGETITRSPVSISAVQPVPVGPGTMTSSLTSPSSRVNQLVSNDQPDHAEFEERRTSSGHYQARGSLSGGTEAAVARDAFEGMIETLSRTKESIGRATRQAIDCAKHGIANEVVELLTRKLENESSFHRRVDIFFLVDSITQCSHSQKGIAGASYIPSVQSALPRIIGAAAPPGANARENRRQCLKVLKLWLERKILPDTLLKRCIDDIGSSNDDVSGGVISKRPSRSERAVDDPIREMEGMLVDEYGSNATFQLPGFLSANVFEEDEEDDDDVLNLSHKEDTAKSTLLNPATGEPETCSATSNDRRHHILEDVDGELEMEDVSGHPKDEKFSTSVSYKAFQDETMDTTSNNSNEVSVSPLRPGSPPLPPDSPPPTPPLPSSPPPPLSPLMVPPPPSSPSPPPPPPPPLPSSQPYPVPPPNSGSPQVLFTQVSVTPQPSIPQLVHPYQSPMPSNVPMNAAVRGEMFLQQPSGSVPALASSSREASVFNSSRAVEYGHEMYTNPQGSHSNQQFQSANVPMPSRPFQPSMLTQTVVSQYQYPNPAMLQHPYPTQYGPTKPLDSLRRYGADEQWRPPLNEFRSSGRSSGPPFAQEGYFRPPMERPPANNVAFQPIGQNIVPAGPPIPGHTGSMMPSLNSWRPA
ncbi:ENHANCER OF AG-4 protein 2-like [Rutidosis leptorrhynchoides]|uniref:ENHANCER OF AG-4 protein 2-like n=1 Tax=Rutidosis leptorrhynchoides TaxID=125765 RepID=UPI003A991EFD